MTPEEIQGDYQCSISIEDFRVVKKAEYKVVVRIGFYSSRTHSKASTSWHIWRTFNAFRKLDEQLRKRNTSHMKGIKFPPLYRRKSLFRGNLRSDFLENRMRELHTYMNMVIRSPQVVAFHMLSIQSQSLKAFVSFSSGFGQNANYEQQDAALRPSISILASQELADVTTASVMGDDDDEFKSVSSFSTVSSVTSITGGPHDYRWSGTGFVGTSSFAKQPMPTNYGVGANGYGANGPGSSSFVAISGHGYGGYGVNSNSFGSSYSNNSFSHVSSFSDNRLSTSSSLSGAKRDSTASLTSMTPSSLIAPELDIQRAKMEEQLLQINLAGVGMPPDGSCFLHCIVYEMYPLMCLRDYPPTMSVVNVGAADGMAPRRIAAAHFLRVQMMEYALTHVEKLGSFLMQEGEDLKERYETFRDTPDEQATIAELYAASSMFNIEIVLISNDESFKIDPVLPIAGLPSVREGGMRTITLGYMTPADGCAGHYICTRERWSAFGGPNHSFVGGSYRGSINIGPPKSMRSSMSARPRTTNHGY